MKNLFQHKGHKEYTKIHKEKAKRQPLFSPFCVLCVFFVAFVFPCLADWQAQTVDSLQKITALAPGVLETYKSEPVVLRAVRGEWENFQIVVRADETALSEIDVSISGLQSPNGATIGTENIHFYWENYVYVPHPSGNRRLEKLWWPDALIPPNLQKDTSIAPNHARVLWINVRVPQNTPLGYYQGHIQIRADNETKSVPFAVSVGRDKKTGLDTLPAPTFRANVAVYYDVLRDWYTKNARPLSDEEFAQLKKNYYDFLLEYRINAYDLPVEWKSDAAQQYLRDPRVLSVRTPPLDRPDFAEALAAFKKADALKKAYYYWIDEPAPEQYDAVKSATKKLRELGIAHCVTTFPNKSLKNDVDIWCPNIGDFFGLKHLDFASLAAERKTGAEIWLYTMAWPRHPYPTWLLDDDAISMRSYGWLWAQNNITGFVYSMAHGWGPNPFENLQSFGETNGDGTLLYPAVLLASQNLYPLPSIRLMLLRDAIEDYELRRQPAKKDYAYNFLFDTPNCKDSRARLAIYSGSLPKINGRLNDASWNKTTLLKHDLQRLPQETAPVSTKVWISHHDKNLLIAARCSLMPRSLKTEVKGDWFAIDLATNNKERLRFIVTPSGKGIIEKHTREGHFRIEGSKWKFAAHATRDFYNIEMQIPLDEINLNNQFRFNARRRLHDTQLDIHYLLNAFQDAEDVTLMPVAELLEVTTIFSRF